MLDSPYKGLMPYTEEDAPFFFGREAEREVITANLMASRLTLLYGLSGVGKSSVVRAGVAHQLRQAAQQNLSNYGAPEIAVVVFSDWRDDPVALLEERVREAVEPFQTEDGKHVPLPDDPIRHLPELLEAWTKRINGDLLIVLDQFEEYFLYHPQEDGKETFAAQFPRVLNRPDLRVNFLIAIREDALAQLDRFKGHIPQLFDNYSRIDHLDREAARAAIEKPLEQYNRLRAVPGQEVSIEPALVQAVLEEVKTGQVILGEVGRGELGIGAKSSSSETRIETSYLQLVMTRLWEEEREIHSRIMRRATFDRLGRAKPIVQAHLDNVMTDLLPNEQETAAKVFQYLVTRSGTKIAYPALDLAGEAGIGDEHTLVSVLQKLSHGEVRILRPVGPVPGQPTEPRYERYEIFHDVLAPAVLDWRARHIQVQERTAAERRAQEQQQRAEDQARTAERLRQALAAAEAAAQEAERQKFIAEQQARIATSRQLAAQSLSRYVRLDVALLLSLEANRLADTIEGRSSLLEGVQRNPHLTMFLHGHLGSVRSIVWSPDGKILASGSGDNTIILWDIQTRQPLGEPLKGHTDSVWSVAFSPDGKVLASGSGDTIILWDVSLESWKARACRRANRNLTRAEWKRYIGDIEPYRATCLELPIEPEKPDEE